MPSNPALFPSEYSELCPGTNLPEDNRLDELERKLLILRQQHVLGNRTKGQGLAELQNQSLTVAAVLTPVNGLGRTLVIGGSAPFWYGIHGQIDKINHGTFTVASVDVSLAEPSLGGAGLTALIKAVVLGGQTGVNGVSFFATRRIELIDWITETRAVSGTQLSDYRSFSGSAEQASSFEGLVAAGAEPIDGATGASQINLSSIERIRNWASGTPIVDVYGAALSSVTGYGAGVQSPTHGYFSGATNRQINKVIFGAAASVSTLAATLTEDRVTPATCQDYTTGYWANGTTISNYSINTRSIDQMPFSSETPSALTQVLTTYPGSNRSGAETRREGLLIAGASTASGFNINSDRSFRLLEALDFAGKTLTPLSEGLNRGGRCPTAISK